jgi:flagellar M-ring protein FliF
MAAIDVDGLKRRATAAYRAFTPAQLVLAGLLTVLTLVGGMMFYRWVSAPSYAVLYSGLDAKDAADVTAKLTTDGVNYKLTGNGSAIEVPSGALDKERVALGAAGLPKGGTGGWESLDKEGLTTSSFRQQVDYQRALEGEIAKTLRSIDGIDDAQVHLVLPEERLFTDQQRNARASVVLTTRRTLMNDQVQAVTSTVSSAVPDLAPDAVSITDSDGRLLSSHAGGNDDQSAAQATFEDSQTARAQSMLDQLLGAGHSVVRVSATLDFDKSKSTVKTVDSNKSAVTGSQKSTETYRAPNGSTSGGAVTATDPTAAIANTTTGASQYEKKSENTTVVPSEKLEEIQKATGTVNRQSVAVVLDTTAKNLPPNAQVQQLVAAALGLDPKRGDTIVVSSAGFDTGTPAATGEKSAGLLGGKSLSTIVAAIMLLLITLLLARSARRPKVKAIDLPEVLPALPASRADTVALPTGTDRTALPAGSIPSQRQGQASEVDLLQAVETQPDDVAHLLRGWLSEAETNAPTSRAGNR